MKRGRAVLVVLVAACAVCAEDEAYVLTRGGRRLTGLDVRCDDTGAVTLIKEGGQKLVFPRGRYRSACAPRPAALDEALAALEDGRHAEAERALREISDRYCGLKWDLEALRALVRVGRRRDRHADAARALETLFTRSPRAASDDTLRAAYLDALEHSAEDARIEQEIEHQIRRAGRRRAAAAYRKRAARRYAQGETARARTDRRIVELFFGEPEQVKTGVHE
ncbi:hypothetical protein [Kiritimatiella glycovorans]|uniref:Uncharacterized protein n=1 Tax=Kiritimatiella glycovorans TaxID=1307763 RepID=A0A0G3EGW6_9BACT|nr:hypothetical protein [Kiritimatiella glycovorans]AKJ63369.1 hypothetical protein L21SP4_00082 [Kiritimatiella glycovorans]